LKELYEACQEEVKDYEVVFVMRTRAQLMWQYLNGEASLWEAQKEVDVYVSYGGDMADLVATQVAAKEDIVDTAGTENKEAAINYTVEDKVVAPSVQEEDDVGASVDASVPRE
ncbi:hypothetical protein SOVF_171930, partial [Spinacia oleracea]